MSTPPPSATPTTCGTKAAKSHAPPDVASPDGGTISLTSYPRADQVVVEVADEGPGVPDAELSRLFDKFYRGAGAKRLPGTGLGLSIVRGVMQGMGGQASAALRVDAPSGMVMSLALPAARG